MEYPDGLTRRKNLWELSTPLRKTAAILFSRSRRGELIGAHLATPMHYVTGAKIEFIKSSVSCVRAAAEG